MKKLIALLLALVMCLSLCACGADAEKIELYDKYDKLIDYMEDEKYDKAYEYIVKKAMKAEGSGSEEGGLEGDLAEKEQARQNEYDRLMREIENLEDSLANDYTYSMSYQVEGSDEWTWIEGSEAYLRLRDDLLAMDGYKDTKELAERFTVLEDMMIGTIVTWTDALGNNNEEKNLLPYAYDKEGNIIKGVVPEEFQSFTSTWDRYNYEYDADGMLVSLKLMYDDTINAVIDITYNADGTVAGYEYKSAGGYTRSATYIYEGGRLVQQTYTDGYGDQYVINYTYNEAGQLIMTQEEEVRDYTWRYVDTVAYTYDADGNIATKRVSEFYYYNNVVEGENYVHEWTYTYDDNGRIATALDTHLGNFNELGEQTDNNLEFPKTHTYNYGQYCVYTPAN